MLAAALCLAVSARAQEQAPALLLARVLHEKIEVTHYLVSEKYDGVRAVWDSHVLRFRSGRIVPAPPWFLATLPDDMALDGELWLGRGRFDELSGIVRRVPADEVAWRKVRYMVFDAPAVPGSFAQRLAVLCKKFCADALRCDCALPGDTARMRAGQPVEIVLQQPLRNRSQLQRRLHDVVRLGGEGLMLHRADAAYRPGRSDDLLKLKPLLDDEATVIGHVPGKGKYRGLVGALLMRMNPEQGGRTFRLAAGLDDALRRAPPPLGARVSYRYNGLTPGGLPRFARYWRLREEF